MKQSPNSAPQARGLSSEQPLTISQLNWQIKHVLERALPSVWAEGEVCDLSRPSSGHLYFTLKDEQSQVRAVLWRSTAQRLPYTIEDGMSIVCNGAVEVYAPRGSYQLIVNRLQPKGIGALQLAFQQLHGKLSKEGLFAGERKRPLPRFPRRIGFVTSPSGAALHDFLEAARGRWSDFSLVVIPARVQGQTAAREIVHGIQLAQRLAPPLDLLIVGRGGGSVEDLWCFNEEAVVRAMAACNIPTISAVGHEIDVTLSDLVADARGLTPTHAAQLALPDAVELQNYLRRLDRTTASGIRNRLSHLKQRLDTFAQRSVLARPHQLHQQRKQQIDDLELRARNAIWQSLRARSERIAGFARAVEALSPLGVLARGYSLTHPAGSLTPVRTIDEVAIDERLTTVLAQGRLTVQVLEKHASD